jgi:glycosyltransferase involved in cell wall biosynthesis
MIGVVIPARNEMVSVGGVVRATSAALPEAHIVVVDDASNDATSATARTAGAHVVRLARHAGYASALRTGYHAALDAGATHIAQIDGDGQHPAGSAVDLLAELDRYDLVLGSRFLGSGYPMPVGRRLGITACRMMMRAAGDLRLTDPTSGFRAVRPAVAIAIAEEGFPDGLTEGTFLIHLHRQGFSIGEVPVAMNAPRNGSMHDGLAGLAHLARISRATLTLALDRRRR